MATIEGTITLNNGKTVEFSLEGSQYGGYEWSQWGATNDVLWETAEALEAMATALNNADFDPEPECEKCGCELERGEGSLCEDCNESED